MWKIPESERQEPQDFRAVCRTTPEPLEVQVGALHGQEEEQSGEARLQGLIWGRQGDSSRLRGQGEMSDNRSSCRAEAILEGCLSCPKGGGVGGLCLSPEAQAG